VRAFETAQLTIDAEGRYHFPARFDASMDELSRAR
jgi:hypothetical protein